MLEEFDGATPTPAKLPSCVQTWIQVHRVSPLYRTEAILK